VVGLATRLKLPQLLDLGLTCSTREWHRGVARFSSRTKIRELVDALTKEAETLDGMALQSMFCFSLDVCRF
jgi:hypothetical protein